MSLRWSSLDLAKRALVSLVGILALACHIAVRVTRESSDKEVCAAYLVRPHVCAKSLLSAIILLCVRLSDTV